MRGGANRFFRGIRATETCLVQVEWGISKQTLPYVGSANPRARLEPPQVLTIVLMRDAASFVSIVFSGLEGTEFVKKLYER